MSEQYETIVLRAMHEVLVEQPHMWYKTTCTAMGLVLVRYHYEGDREVEDARVRVKDGQVVGSDELLEQKLAPVSVLPLASLPGPGC